MAGTVTYEQYVQGLETELSELNAQIFAGLQRGKDVSALEQKVAEKAAALANAPRLQALYQEEEKQQRKYSAIASYQTVQKRIDEARAAAKEIEAQVIPLRQQLKPLEIELQKAEYLCVGLRDNLQAARSEAKRVGVTDEELNAL